MRYSLLKKVNQNKELVKNELEKLFNKYDVKLNILQYKEIKDGKFYPGYIEYDWDNNIGCKKLEKILNKYDWEIFLFISNTNLLNNVYDDIFPIEEEIPEYYKQLKYE